MKKAEIKKAANNEILVDYIESYALLMCNYNLGRGTNQLEKHCRDIEAELLKRGLLNEEDIKRLNI